MGKYEKHAGKVHLTETDILADLLSRLIGAEAPELASFLIGRHGSLASLLIKAGANIELDHAIRQDVLLYLASLSQFLVAGLAQEAFKGEVISTSFALLSYLRLDMSSLKRECVRVLYLDAQNRLIEDRHLWEGTVNEVHAYPREVVRIGLELCATALILVHNHPGGDPTPSGCDRELTRRIRDACTAVDIALHDHVIVSSKGAFSFRSNAPIPMVF